MDVEKQMQDALRLSQEENEKGKKKYQSDSRARLFKITSTKVRTAFIGALSSFEQNFGELWGHRLPESELTDEQLEEVLPGAPWADGTVGGVIGANADHGRMHWKWAKDAGVLDHH
mgnify:CR=1 FL=1